MALVCLSGLFSRGFNIVGVVPPHRNEGTFELMCSFADSLKLPLIFYKDRMDEVDFLHAIRQLNADIAVVCSYNKKLPPELLKTTKDGFVNCHPSLLPEYRGANPYSNVLINGEKETGITLHFMDENFDTGNIIAQKKVPIEKNETMGTLFNRMNYMCAELLAEFLQQYEVNSNVISFPQPEGEFKKAPAIDSRNMKNFIDWSKDAAYIENSSTGAPQYLVSAESTTSVIFASDNAQLRHNQTNIVMFKFGEGASVATVVKGTLSLENHLKGIVFTVVYKDKEVDKVLYTDYVSYNGTSKVILPAKDYYYYSEWQYESGMKACDGDPDKGRGEAAEYNTLLNVTSNNTLFAVYAPIEYQITGIYKECNIHIGDNCSIFNCKRIVNSDSCIIRNFIDGNCTCCIKYQSTIDNIESCIGNVNYITCRSEEIGIRIVRKFCKFF